MRNLLLALLTLGLVACSEPDPRYVMEPQEWGDIVVKIESQPIPVRAGSMNEFLVLATTEHGRPVHNMVVSMRADPRQKWEQGIQDGYSGVYRKAIMVPKGAKNLYVQMRKWQSEEEKVLAFPFVFADSR